LAWPEGLKDPGAQGKHFELSPALKDPGSQGKHVVAPVSLFVRDPAPHGKQAPLKACGAKRPLSHEEHSTSLLLYSPALQSAQKMPSSLLIFPAGHCVQLSDPEFGALVPTGHWRQVVGKPLEAFECFEYLPASHFTHAPVPST
jgi:hypothetical protein